MIASAFFLSSVVMASSNIPQDQEHFTIWALCLETKTALAGREEPDPSLAVATAMVDCSPLEANAQEEFVRRLARATTVEFASGQGPSFIASYKVKATADLLDKAERAYEAAKK